MPTTVVPDRFHAGFTFGAAGSITPAIDDKVALFDASNSDARSYATLRTLLWEIAKTQHRYQFHHFTDFVQETSTSAGDNSLSESNSTGSTGQIANDIQGRIGQVQLTTSNSATGRTYVGTSAAIIRFGGGIYNFETAVNVATLSVTAQRFQFLAGFIDLVTSPSQVDGCYFLYDEGGVAGGSTAAAYWQTVTSSNNSRTYNTSLTQTTVNAAQWYRLGIEVNAAANSVAFAIDGTTVATHTANIPSATGRQTGYGLFLIKSNGTTARTVDADYVNVCCDFTSAR